MRISTQRVFAALLVALLALTFATASARADVPDPRQPITISAKDMPMRTFLSEIEKQCNYTFFYSNSVLNGASDVTIEAASQPLEELLHKVFDGSSRTFEIVGSKIVIKLQQSPTLRGGE